MSDPKAPDLDQAGQFRGRPNLQLSGDCVEMDTVIADQNGGRKLPGAAGEYQLEGEAGLAGAGGAADQHGAISHPHGGSVHAGALGRHGAGAGSRTTKRAPSTVGLPSAPSGPWRFSAQIRPLCASMICLEIDSPSPEFWPKPWCGRSV